MSEPWTTADRREVGGAEEDVEDRLGAEVRDGGAADVLDVDRGVGEGRVQLGGGVAEVVRPLGSGVEEEDGIHRSDRCVSGGWYRVAEVQPQARSVVEPRRRGSSHRSSRSDRPTPSGVGSLNPLDDHANRRALVGREWDSDVEEIASWAEILG